MAIPAHYGNRYFGNWYSDSEAQKIQVDLQENCSTGDMWVWIRKSGETVAFSGSKKD